MSKFYRSTSSKRLLQLWFQEQLSMLKGFFSWAVLLFLINPPEVKHKENQKTIRSNLSKSFVNILLLTKVSTSSRKPQVITLTFTGKPHSRQLVQSIRNSWLLLTTKKTIVDKTTVLNEEVSQIQAVWENKCVVGHQNSHAGKTLILKTLILLLLIKHSEILKKPNNNNNKN